MFFIECISHVLAGACKAGMVSVKLDDVLVDTEDICKNIQRCITWTDNLQKGAEALEVAQQHAQLPKRRLLAPVPTIFFLSHPLLTLHY